MTQDELRKARHEFDTWAEAEPNLVRFAWCAWQAAAERYSMKYFKDGLDQGARSIVGSLEKENARGYSAGMRAGLEKAAKICRSIALRHDHNEFEELTEQALAAKGCSDAIKREMVGGPQ